MFLQKNIRFISISPTIQKAPIIIILYALYHWSDVIARTESRIVIVTTNSQMTRWICLRCPNIGLFTFFGLPQTHAITAKHLNTLYCQYFVNNEACPIHHKKKHPKTPIRKRCIYAFHNTRMNGLSFIRDVLCQCPKTHIYYVYTNWMRGVKMKERKTRQ